MRRLIGILLTAAFFLGWGQMGARADESDWRITRYDMTMVADRDGSIDVTLDFDFDFADTRGHGPFLVLPRQMEVPDDPDRWRVLDISQVSASSSTGAPANVHTERSGGVLELRIGSENRYVSGLQSYQVTFTVDGVVNPDVDGMDEIAWNAIAGFELPISNATVTLEGPDEIQQAECVAGERNATTACTDQQITDNRVQWSQSEVATGDGMTVVAGFPAGTFPDAEPQFAKRYHLGNTVAITPGTVGASGLLAALGIGAVALTVRRKGRDEAWTGLTPGLTPGAETTGAVGYRDKKAPVAVQFSPPEGARPAQLGTLMAEQAGMKEVSATLVDLAVRGYLQIKDVRGDDKRLIKLRGPSGLLPYEKAIYDGVFATSDSPRLSKVKNMAEVVSTAMRLLYRTVTQAGWFRKDPSHARTGGFVLGGAVTLAGLGLAFVLGAAAGWALIGLAVALVGVVIVFSAPALPARTAAGSAMLAQAKGFELYLTTAEADQLRFEEGEDLFSKYLPYAIVFGVAERWTKLFAQLAAEGRVHLDTSWYVGPYLLMANPGAFANDMVGLSDSMSSAMTEASTSSMSAAGGSGFGGGVGGGVGGVGGGGW